MKEIKEVSTLKNRATLLLCVLLVIAASVMLTSAVPPTDKPDMPEQAPLQTCVEGTITCAGNNSYYCAENNQWLLQEANSEFCGYEAPSVCNKGEAMCFGFNEYTCLNNEWVLTALNNESCGYVCTSGASYCDGVNLSICVNNAWTVVEDSPSCGYVAPMDVQKKVLSNIFYNTELPCAGSATGHSESVTLDDQYTVTLHSGGVSGGIYWANGGVPGVAFVTLCNVGGGPEQLCTDEIALPLYSEVSFNDIGYIRLEIRFLSIPDCVVDDHHAVSMASNIVYSIS